MRLRKLWEPLDGVEATLHEHQAAAEIARIGWCIFAIMLVVVVFLVAGCNMTKPTQPINVHCDALCFQQCDQLTAWDGDRDGDRLAALFDAHDVEHQQCEQHRVACTVCLSAAKAAKAIQ